MLASCSFGSPPPPEAGQPPKLPTPSGDPELEASAMIAEAAVGVDQPWDMDFLPDGTALFTERESARLMSIPFNEEDNTTGDPAEELAVEDVATEGTQGLLGLAVSPDFEDDETVFLYYSTDSDNRVAAWEYGSGDQPEPILTGIPTGVQLNGGALEFDEEGLLWVGTGDASYLSEAQAEDSLGGKILRVTTDGEPAPGNPDPDSPVYSSGHRSVNAIAFRESDSEPVAIDSSPNVDDYVVQVRAGANYGWPRLEEEFDSDSYSPPIGRREPQIGECSGSVFLGELLASTCLRGQRLWLAEPNASGSELEDVTELFMNEFGQLRSIAMGPDGLLWVGTYNRGDQCNSEVGCYPQEEDDRILRISLPGHTSGIGLT